MLLDADTNNHVEMIVRQALDHRRSTFRAIGTVAIYEDVNVRVDVSEHSAHDMSLSLPMFLVYLRSCLPCVMRGFVCRIVVVDEDVCVGECMSKVGNHLSNSGFFIVAWNKDGEKICVKYIMRQLCIILGLSSMSIDAEF